MGARGNPVFINDEGGDGGGAREAGLSIGAGLGLSHNTSTGSGIPWSPTDNENVDAVLREIHASSEAAAAAAAQGATHASANGHHSTAHAPVMYELAPGTHVAHAHSVAAATASSPAAVVATGSPGRPTAMPRAEAAAALAVLGPTLSDAASSSSSSTSSAAAAVMRARHAALASEPIRAALDARDYDRVKHLVEVRSAVLVPTRV
jgi:hypothetical protein